MRVARNALIYFGANVVNAGVPFVLLPILTRVLTPADYGTVAMFTILLSVFGAFTGLSVHGSINVRFFQLDMRRLAEYVTCCVGILALSGATTLVIVAVLRFPLERATGVPAEWVVVAVAASCLQVLVAIRLSLWQAAGKAGAYAVFQVGQCVLNVGLSLVLVLVLGWAWQGRVVGQTVAVAAFGFLAIAMLAGDGLLRRPRDWSDQSSDALRFGLPLIPHVLGALAISSGGQVLVTNMLGMAETGLYVVAAQLGAAMGLVSDAFVKTYGPWLYKRLSEDTADERHFVVGVTYCLFAAFLIVSALVSALLYWAFPLVVGEEFSSARALATPFVFANGFVGMYYAVAGLFFFSSRTHFVSIVTIVSGAFSILTMWLLGEEFGSEGIAVGYLASNAMMFVLAWVLSNRVHPLPWLQMRAAFTSLWARSADA